ncbi:MAG: SDR family oxidoreductase [Spirochaetia bacterium]|nr:SDR family oxidoreductase [Spirochaetia bacterium]
MSKTILITGGSTGIGAATAVSMAEGNKIFLHYNSSVDAARETARRVESNGGEAYLIQADLSSESGCESLFKETSAHTEHLDVLINNAGGLVERQYCRELQWKLLERVFALNTFSAMKVTSLAIPLLEKGTNPAIVNISSVAARHGAPSATAYGAAKGALDSFTRGLAKELAPKIRVNAVAPGVIDTPFHKKVSTPEMMENWRKGTPLQKNGRADDIAHAVLFLIENQFTTGETVDVNGGTQMR